MHPTIRAELTGDDTCSALGVTVRAHASVLGLCRALVEAGHDPRRPLHAYRGDVLALVVRSIGEGSHLEINGDGTGFRPLHKPGRAPPIENSGSPPVRATKADAVAVAFAAALANIARRAS
jgi:hypothetical protein